MACGTGTSRCCPQLVHTCCRLRLRAATTMRFAWRRAPSPRKTCSETVPSTVARPTEPVLQHVGPPAARIDLNDSPVGDAWCANQRCWQQKAEGVRSGHRWARLAASRLLQSPFGPLAKPEVGPGQPSYRISANLKYTISDPCMEDRVRFDQLKRREFITLLGGSLSGLRGTRSARTQETSQVFISRKGPWGFDLSGMDLAIKPGDDFFRYSNGVWFDQAVIAPDRNTNSVDTVLSDSAEVRIREILMRGETGVERSARDDAAKIGIFYSNFMDEARVEALDANPIAPLIRMLRIADTHADLAELMVKTFFRAIFSLSIEIDAKAPNKYAVVIRQGGLGLPNRDYYLTAQLSDEREAYLAYMVQILTLIGWQTPKEFAAAILTFETAIAEASWSLA